MDSQTYQVQLGDDDTREINTEQESLQPLPGTLAYHGISCGSNTL